ncbi:uncharacterized protein ARMOST_22373 [Armillaria ostoyae]|uniref:Integrase catalytic domain-containing protein n=1 Tax=Armillaria ostoyae TaxID=47428 RepID=A0A284SCQ9_ARMOS|nr:uncharacterized protein ARMOST_22373 [Armillaria ostoyae]
MLKNPDIAPSAAVNRWIIGILSFHFVLVHVPGSKHGPDGLSRRPPQLGDPPPPEDGMEDFLYTHYGLMHFINSTSPTVNSPIKLIQVLQQDITEDTTEIIPYSTVPRTTKQKRLDERLMHLLPWHLHLKRPLGFDDNAYAKFMKYAVHFFEKQGKLWRKNVDGKHQLVLFPERRIQVMTSCHDDVAHKGFYATHALIKDRYWWPDMKYDIAWFVRTCHLCQIRQTRQIYIPPTVALPAPLFSKMYMDTMIMPVSGQYRYIVQGRCSLSHYPEFRCLRKETARTLGEWIFEDILCRWGSLVEIVTDNGSAFVAAINYLSKKYHINHIRISGYNSRANGIAERPHFDVRQGLFKASDGDQKKWSQNAYSVFWADRVTIRKRMGCSPYFAATGTEPLLPMDIVESTWLMPPPDNIISTTSLIARRAINLQKRSQDLERLKSKVYEARRNAAVKFEKDHAYSIRDFNFQKGDLVLMRNTQIEKALNRKMRARYLGPLVILGRNKGGAYLLCELDGSTFARPVAAFRLVPYFARKKIDVPDINAIIDVPPERINDLFASTDDGTLDELPDQEGAHNEAELA